MNISDRSRLNGRQRLRECVSGNVSDIDFGLPHRKAVNISFGDAGSEYSVASHILSTRLILNAGLLQDIENK
jgi:hypothetical protein